MARCAGVVGAVGHDAGVLYYFNGTELIALQVP